MHLIKNHIKPAHPHALRAYTLLLTLVIWGNKISAQEDQIILSGWPETFSATNIAPTDTSRINTLLQLGEMLKEKNRDSSLLFFGAALGGSIKTRYTYGIITALSGLGSIQRDQGAYEQAIDYYTRAIRLCRQLHAEHMLPGLYNAFGRLYARQGKYREATEFYYKGIRIADQLSPAVNADFIYNNLAISLTQSGRSYKEILFYLDKAEQTAIKEGNHALLGAVLINKGIAYNTIKAWDSSRYYFYKALELGRIQNIPHTIHTACSNIGITYLEEENPEKAMPYLLKADSMNPQVDPFHQNITFYTLGDAYFKQGKYKQAEQLLLEGLNRAQALKHTLVLREIYLILGKLYGTTHQYNKAYTYLRLYVDINNSIAGEEVTHNVNQLEVRYRTAQKDKEIAEKKLLLAQQERRIEQKNIWIAAIASGIVLLITLLVALYRSYQHKKRSQANRIQLLQQQQELLRKEQEIGQLKAMMKGEEQERIRIGRELHDGIGGLLSAAKINFSAIQRRNSQLAATEDYNNTLMLLDEATSELRKTAHNLMPEILMKSGLAEAITTFCERIQRGQELDIHVQCYGDLPRLDTSFELAIYRIIQELIHNIVKHAHAQSALVQFNWQEEVFNIMVEDDGVGMPDPATSGKPGIGLDNIRSRVRALNGQMDIESTTGKGTTICITFDRKEIPGQHETTIRIAKNRPTTA